MILNLRSTTIFHKAKIYIETKDPTIRSQIITEMVHKHKLKLFLDTLTIYYCNKKGFEVIVDKETYSLFYGEPKRKVSSFSYNAPPELNPMIPESLRKKIKKIYNIKVIYGD